MKRMRKTAWELRAGDVIEADHKGISSYFPVLSVRRMMFTGDFDGRYFQESPVVRLELSTAGNFALEPGDKQFIIHRRSKGANQTTQEDR